MTASTDRGTFVEHDGRPAVRFVRTYPHPVEAVWAAITEPARTVHWFPGVLHLEPRVGGTVTVGGDPNAPDPNAPDPNTPDPNTAGTVLAWDPPRRVAFSWGDDELHLSVEPDGAGSVLTLVNVLAATDTAARNAAGWAVCLDELAKHLAGERADGPHSPTATSWRPVYDAYVADGMPSGAPIPGA